MSKYQKRKLRREQLRRATEARVRLVRDTGVDQVNSDKISAFAIGIFPSLVLLSVVGYSPTNLYFFALTAAWSLCALCVMYVMYYNRFVTDYDKHRNRTMNFDQHYAYASYVEKTDDPEERIQRGAVYWPIHDEIISAQKTATDLEERMANLEELDLKDQPEYVQAQQLAKEARQRETKLKEALDSLAQDSDYEKRMKQLQELQAINNAIDRAQGVLAERPSLELDNAMQMYGLVGGEGEFDDIMREIELESNKRQTTGGALPASEQSSEQERGS
jgi:hypothetical protein